MTTKLLVVIVNFRTPEVTAKCLHSVFAGIEDLDGQVVVVENGSGDDSAEKLRGEISSNNWGGWCELLCSSENLGFSGGNNLAIRREFDRYQESCRELPAYVLLLNSDTIVHGNCLAHCVGVMDRFVDVGAMSCRLLNADGSLQPACRRFFSPLRLIVGATGLPWRFPWLFGWAETEYRSWDMSSVSGDAEWIGGAFMLIRSSVLKTIGLLDQDFFFYGEDTELCFRIRNAGWRIFYDPTETITHLGGASSDPTRILTERRSRESWRARYLFVRKCYGRPSMLAVRIVDCVMLMCRRWLLRLFGKGTTVRYQQVDTAYRSVWGDLGPL